MSATPIVCDRCPVADRAVCAVLSEADRDHLTRLGRRQRYRRGETILAAGHPHSTCGTLVSGAAKLSSIDSDGTERILALIHPAGTLGQMFATTERLHVTALTDSEACLFPAARFEALADERPRLARRMLAEALRELEESRTLIDLISKRQADARLAALLLAFARAASTAACHDALRFELPLTRGEIAQMLGVTIETVSRTLTRFERDGALRREGAHGIALLDSAALGGLVG